MRKGRRGRPRLISPEKKAGILKAIRLGLSYKDAAISVGISYDTFNRWRNEGASPNATSEFCDFCNDLRQAEIEGKAELLKTISSEARRNWRAASWLLERRYADEWGRNRLVVSPDENSGSTPEEEFCDTFGVVLEPTIPKRAAAKQFYESIEAAMPIEAVRAVTRMLGLPLDGTPISDEIPPTARAIRALSAPSNR